MIKCMLNLAPEYLVVRRHHQCRQASTKGFKRIFCSGTGVPIFIRADRPVMLRFYFTQVPKYSKFGSDSSSQTQGGHGGRESLASSSKKPPSAATPAAARKASPDGSLAYTEYDNWKAMKQCIEYMLQNDYLSKLRILVSMCLLVASKVANIQVPIYFKHIVDSLSVTGEQIAMVPLATIVSYGVARSVASIFHEFRTVIFNPVTQSATKKLSLDTFKHFHNMDLNWHLSRKIGSISKLVERGTRGIHQVLNTLLFVFTPTFLEIMFVIGILGSKFGAIHAAFTFFMVSIYAIYTILLTKWRTQFRIELNAHDSEMSSHVLDSLINYETMKYFNSEAFEAEKHSKFLEKYNEALKKTNNSLALLNSGQSIIISCALAGGVLLAAQGIANGTMTIGDMVLINGLLLQLAFPLNFLGSAYRELKQALIDMSSLFNILNKAPAIQNRSGAKSLFLKKGEIEFKNVSFDYVSGSPVLSDANFTIRGQKKVAIVGSSGNGKSTILRLIYRFYDVSKGSVLIDGQDVRDVTLYSLREAIGVVPQDLVLFNSSILHNITYGCPSASMEQVLKVSRLANVESIIKKMAFEYDTPVGERGLLLSGGEKQRICLARTLLKNPKILILDEATSSLDTENEEAIQASIDRLVENGKTVLVLSHRLKTVCNSDHILLLENGRIVEQGSHRELMRARGRYFSMVQKQNITYVEEDDPIIQRKD
ncbi:uncharacterized protein LOC126318637 [Schistocerca gregaria]|uniref:uncharacterized protein LOC126318637 n=1 Tax=Schistocerca gregaria TaxID=7010 RepID=UPI00211EBBDA|nr:uncharacterized protein LOC126318637 [Schistocerca gregaria]